MDKNVYDAQMMAELIRHISQGQLPFVIAYAEPDPESDVPNTVIVKVMASDISTLPSFARHLLHIHISAELPKGMVMPDGYRPN